MRLLLDTHVVIWWLNGDPKLSHGVRDLLQNELEVFISPASLWEITIKQSMGKLDAPADLAETIRDSDFHELPVRHRHTITAGRLQAIHRDPFDRLLVAQAQCEKLTLVSTDEHMPKYDVAVMPP